MCFLFQKEKYFLEKKILQVMKLESYFERKFMNDENLLIFLLIDSKWQKKHMIMVILKKLLFPEITQNLTTMNQLL